jgi:hypothetical protein
VIESPDGKIQYCKPILISTIKSNQTNDIIKKDCNILENSINLEYQTYLVRLLCLCDLITGILLSYYNIPVSVLISIISLNGFCSTYTYNQSSLFSYLIFQYIQTIYKIMCLICYIEFNSINSINSINNTSIHINYDTILLSDFIDNTIILSIYVISQIYITYFIQYYYIVFSHRIKRSNESLSV